MSKLINIETETPKGIRRRPVQLWLPPGWQESDRKALLIMHDGQNLFREEDSFDGTWGVAPTLERMTESGMIPPVAVAGIWNSGTTRWLDYMPPVLPDDDPLWKEWKRENQVTNKPVRSVIYGKYVAETVIPALSHELGDPGELDIFTMGSSMGGLISLELITRFPHIFKGAGCLSTHWTAADDPTVDYFIPRIMDPGRNRIYFDYGTEDLDEEYGLFQNRMDRAFLGRGWRPGKDFVSYRFFGADHSERAWRRRLEVPLMFLFN